jgi:hypothetical protein
VTSNYASPEALSEAANPIPEARRSSTTVIKRVLLTCGGDHARR